MYDAHTHKVTVQFVLRGKFGKKVPYPVRLKDSAYPPPIKGLCIHTGPCKWMEYKFDVSFTIVPFAESKYQAATRPLVMELTLSPIAMDVL